MRTETIVSAYEIAHWFVANNEGFVYATKEEVAKRRRQFIAFRAALLRRDEQMRREIDKLNDRIFYVRREREEKEREIAELRESLETYKTVLGGVQAENKKYEERLEAQGGGDE